MPVVIGVLLLPWGCVGGSYWGFFFCRGGCVGGSYLGFFFCRGGCVGGSYWGSSSAVGDVLGVVIGVLLLPWGMCWG